MRNLQEFKNFLGTYKEKDIIKAYRVGCAFAGYVTPYKKTSRICCQLVVVCLGFQSVSFWYSFVVDHGRLLIFGATTYDIHRSIKNNEMPPSREQLDYLASQINDSRRAAENPYLGLGPDGKTLP